MPKIHLKLLLTYSFVILIAYLTFLPNFHLALFGDDWLAFFRYLTHLGPQAVGNWNYISYFLTPYGSQDILMGLLRNIFGLQGSYYQLTSFYLRMIAAFSLYPLIFYLTKSKIATFFAVLFFAVTTTGIETTSWVFNMPTYITITFFNIFLYFFLKSRALDKTGLFFIGIFFYYLAYIVSPIRMHGSIPFIFFLELIWVLQNRNKKSVKNALLRFLTISGIFFLIKLSGQSLGPTNEPVERFTAGITQSLQMLTEGRFDFIFYPIIIFGGMIIPSFILPQELQIKSIFDIALFVIFPAFSIFIVLSASVISMIKHSSRILWRKLIIAALIWSLVTLLIYLSNSNTLSNAVNLFLLTFGGYMILFFAILLWKFRSNNISEQIFLPIGWSFLSFFFAWWWMPNTIFPSYHRYLMISVIGVTTLFSLIISLGEGKTKQRNLFLIISAFVILQIFSSHYYSRLMESFHSQQLADKIWSAIPYIPEVGKKPLVFYFESDNTNFVTMHNVITFGFPPHMQLLYHLTESDYAPVPMKDWQEVVSATRDGQSFKPYGYPLKPIPINQVYAFKLEGTDHLVDITQIARQKLIEAIQK